MVQATSLVISVVIMVIQVIWMRRHADRWRWSAPVFLWMLHSAIFYLTVFVTDWPHTNWSALLRLHGLISILIIEKSRLRRGG